MSNLKARQLRYQAKKDPRHASAPAYSFGGRYPMELDVIANNNPFFCKFGTHRCPNGEKLLDQLRRRDDRNIDKLISKRQHWKATPGPGAYRIPRCVGFFKGVKGEVDIEDVMVDRPSEWKIGTGRRFRTYHSLGPKHMDGWQHEGKLKYPSEVNLSPGPGHYFQDSCGATSTFSDFVRPQQARGAFFLATEQEQKRREYFYKQQASKATPLKSHVNKLDFGEAKISNPNFAEDKRHFHHFADHRPFAETK